MHVPEAWFAALCVHNVKQSMLGVLFVLISLFAPVLYSYRLVFEENFSSGLKNWVVEEAMDVSGSCSFYRNNVSNVFVDESGLHLKVTRGEFSLCPPGIPLTN